MSDQEVTANGGPVGNAETPEEQVMNPQAVLKKNRELLARLKAEQDRAKEAQEKLDALEQDKLATAGKKDELIEQLKKQLKEKGDELKGVTQTFARKSVNSQILEAARAMGCDKPEVVIKLADMSDVTVGDDFSVDRDALKSALEKVRDEVPTLFKKTPMAPKDGTPSAGYEAPKSIAKMTVAELTELYKQKALKG